MAILKKINFGNGAHDIAKTVVTAKSGGVMSVAAPDGVTNGKDEQKDYQYELDVNIDGTTLVKSTTTGDDPVTQLAVGTVPAAQVSVADSGDKFAASNVEAALSELKDDIASTGSAAKTYKIVEVASPASTSLKEYKVQVAVGSGAFVDDTASATIVVPKDQHLKSVVLVNQRPAKEGESGPVSGNFLKFTYVLNDSTESDVYVDVSAFLAESEFGDGLEVNNAGVVSAKLGNGLEFSSESNENKSINVKIDSNSEKDSQSTPADFLTVGANGVKIQGIKDEIDRKINALDFTTDAAVAGQYVAAIEETDGVVAVKTRANVSEAVLNNYAKGSEATAVAATDTVNQAISKLENQVDAAKAAATSGITAAIEALDFTDTAVAGQYVSKVNETDGVVSVTRANVSDAVLTGYTKGSAPASTAIAATDDVKGAIAKLEHQVDAAKAAAEAGHSAVAKDANTPHLTVTPSTVSGKTTYTIGENDIASASDLTAEVTRAQSAETAIDNAVGLTKAASGETRTFTPTTNYGGTSTSVRANMEALDAKLAEVEAQADAISYSVSGTELTFYGIQTHS